MATSSIVPPHATAVIIASVRSAEDGHRQRGRTVAGRSASSATADSPEGYGQSSRSGWSSPSCTR